MSEETIEFKDLGLSNLLKALGSAAPRARVGILGGGSRHDEEEKRKITEGGFKGTSFTRETLANSLKKSGTITNAEIGAIHEFGGAKTPVRSFLREPIADHLESRLLEAGALDESAIKKMIEEKSVLTFMKKVGIVAEGIVAEAFDTGGFGKWKESKMEDKKVQQTLVETQQLRNSITSEAK